MCGARKEKIGGIVGAEEWIEEWNGVEEDGRALLFWEKKVEGVDGEVGVEVDRSVGKAVARWDKFSLLSPYRPPSLYLFALWLCDGPLGLIVYICGYVTIHTMVNFSYRFCKLMVFYLSSFQFFSKLANHKNPRWQPPR